MSYISTVLIVVSLHPHLFLSEPELFITILKWWVKNIFYVILNTLFYKNSVFMVMNNFKVTPRALCEK